MDLRAVLFDWRGTLVTTPSDSEWVADALRRLARPAGPGAVADVLAAVVRANGEQDRLDGPGVDSDAALHRATYLDVLADAGLDDELALALYEVESDLSRNAFAADAAEVLQELRGQGLRIAVVSDIHVDLRPAFAAAGLGGLVDVFTLSFEQGCQKPDPRMFTRTLAALGVEPGGALMVGDRSRPDGAAVEQGLTTLLLPPLRDVEDRRLHRVSALCARPATGGRGGAPLGGAPDPGGDARAAPAAAPAEDPTGTPHRTVVGGSSPELDRRLSEELDAHNARATPGTAPARELTVQVLDGADDLVAGLSGWTWGVAGGIAMTWVHPDARGQGHGAQLLRAFEDEARDRGCTHVFTTSFTFQAPDFYRRAGYRDLSRWDGLPTPGTADVHLRKELGPRAEPGPRGKLVLPEGEPAAGPWRVEPVEVLVRLLLEAAGPVRERPRVVAVDGRSGGGKSTLAEQLHAAVPRSAVVHTDDVAWHHSFFDWEGLLARGVLEPLRRGDAVRYRPPGWRTEGRPGAVEVPAGLDLVLVEGVGAGRRELAHLLDAVVWVQSDAAEAERRGLARDIAAGQDGDLEGSTAFWHEWIAQELPFVAAQRTWERADVVVRGTVAAARDPDSVAIAARGGPAPGGPPASVVPGRPSAPAARPVPRPAGAG